MKSDIRYIFGICCLQLIFVTVLYLFTRPDSFYFVSKPLLRFDMARADKLIVSGSQSQAIIQLKGGRWHLPELNDQPANKEKLDQAFQKLADLKTVLPVNRLGSKYEKYYVSPTQFRRRVQIYSEGRSIGEVFIGSSVGFETVYTRLASDDEVYELAISVRDFPAENSAWLDEGPLASNGKLQSL